VAFTPIPGPQPYIELYDNRVLKECTYYCGQIRCRTALYTLFGDQLRPRISCWGEMTTRLSFHGMWEAMVEQHEVAPETIANHQDLSIIVARPLETKQAPGPWVQRKA
jgi:hypothetical protein